VKACSDQQNRQGHEDQRLDVPWKFFEGDGHRFPLALPRWSRNGSCGFLLRQRELRCQRESESLNGAVLRILHGLLDLNLVEIPGMFELSDEVRHCINRSGRTKNRQRIALPGERSQPESVGPYDRIGQGVKEFLTPGTIALQRFDDVDTLL